MVEDGSVMVVGDSVGAAVAKHPNSGGGLAEYLQTFSVIKSIPSEMRALTPGKLGSLQPSPHDTSPTRRSS